METKLSNVNIDNFFIDVTYKKRIISYLLLPDMIKLIILNIHVVLY